MPPPVTAGPARRNNERTFCFRAVADPVALSDPLRGCRARASPGPTSTLPKVFPVKPLNWSLGRASSDHAGRVLRHGDPLRSRRSLHHLEAPSIIAAIRRSSTGTYRSTSISLGDGPIASQYVGNTSKALLRADEAGSPQSEWRRALPDMVSCKRLSCFRGRPAGWSVYAENYTISGGQRRRSSGGMLTEAFVEDYRRRPTP